MAEKLTVGRIVHYYTRNKKEQSNGMNEGPYAAVVAQVHSDVCVNLFLIPNSPLMARSASELCRTSVLHAGAAEDYQSWWEWPREQD